MDLRVGFSRPYGTFRVSNLYPGLRPGLSSAVPTGLFVSRMLFNTASWDGFSRPGSTNSGQALRGLFCNRCLRTG
jgi:hypothetical protein